MEISISNEYMILAIAVNLFFIASAYAFGKRIGSYRTIRAILLNPEPFMNVVQSRNGFQVSIEEDNGKFFVYKKGNNEYVGQGDSEQSALADVANKYPGQKIYYNVRIS